MSKTKTKQRRREAKREHHKKAAKNAKLAASKSAPSTATKPIPKPGKQNAQASANVGATSGSNSKPAAAAAAAATHVQPSQSKREIPFGTYDNILLVGEGDFSFTRCLAVEHGCANVVGTSFDSKEEVREKYVLSTFCGTIDRFRSVSNPISLSVHL
jgi:25S rRNA (uracil2634-N3)-methyltransferase